VIGIVLVSHSHRIAEGAAELAREMGGPDVRIEATGGLDEPDRPIGTDAVLVQRAVERAWSDDGVLVLMDLGSAVLSTEMALELLPEDRRVKILLTDAPLVEGAVAAAVTARIGASLEEVAAEARSGLVAKSAHLGLEAAVRPEPAPREGGGGAIGSARLRVGNPHGLHARPAARFVQTASGFEADVRVSNATRGRGPVSARSLNAVATLGVVQGHEIEVVASGPQAHEAIEAIRALAERGFDDVVEPEPAPVAPAVPTGGERGLPASPGVALGPARRFHVPPMEISPDLEGRGPDEEARAFADPALALGVATAFGGPTSHAAVLARSLGIPAVVGIGAGLLAVAEGSPLALDGDAGTLHVRPTPELTRELERRLDARRQADRTARAAARAPAMTRDGTVVEVAANIGSPDDVPTALAAGCDSVGLFRTEFLFLDRREMPTEDEQEAAYRAVAERLEGRPMVIRTLDVGADKPLPFLQQPPEVNPFLGVRGLRLGLARPELLEPQLRAILRVAADHPVRLMFPMVATIEELEEGRAAPDRVEVGVMIEVPSAAIVAGRLAQMADFFSLGTNDLTQYALAAERGNERVASLADPFHPAVLDLIRRAAVAGENAGRWTGVCGELAADPVAAPLLLGLGARELSMSPPAIPHVKEAVRRVDLATARSLAERALALGSAAEVRGLLRDAFGTG
jgi:dihydroxyacetone kinase phosphotransfer subunit